MTWETPPEYFYQGKYAGIKKYFCCRNKPTDDDDEYDECEYECAIFSTHTFDRLFFLFLSFSRSSLSRRRRRRAIGDEEVSLSLSLFFSLLKRRSDTRPGRPRLFPRTLDRSDFRFVFQVVIVRRELEFRDDVVDQLRVR